MTTVWRRSSYCDNQTCVEVAARPDRVLMRDGKLDDSPVLAFDRQAWDAFVADVKAGGLT